MLALFAVLGYVSVGILVARWARNRIINYHFNSILEKIEKYKKNKYSVYFSENARKAIKENPEQYALDEAMNVSDIDRIPAIWLGLVFWPAAILVLSAFTIKDKLEEKSLPSILPKSKAERIVAKTNKQREQEKKLITDQQQLNKQIKELINTARSAGLDTKGLEAIEQYGGTVSKN